MLEAMALRPGERVLELACGDGEVGLRAAEAVGADGVVVCSGFAEPMTEVVAERAAARQLTQVTTRVLDAEDLDLANERFDVVLCRFGYMLMADSARALSESRSVLDDHGRLALAVWGSPDANPWQALVTDAGMTTLDAPAPEPGTPGPFALADHERLRQLLSAAGFERIVIEDLELEREHESVDQWWAGVMESRRYSRHCPATAGRGPRPRPNRCAPVRNA
jgi:SAM-dependent methyltransferase